MAIGTKVVRLLRSPGHRHAVVPVLQRQPQSLVAAVHYRNGTCILPWV